MRAVLFSLAVFVMAMAAVAEVNDFWDTTGRTIVDVKNSAMSSSAVDVVFETGHEKSVEASHGDNVNTFPSAGFYILVK